MDNRSLRSGALAVVLLALIAACASTQSTVPTVTLKQMSSLPQTAQVQSATGLPVEYQLTVQNPLDRPVTLVSVEVETVGNSGGYALNRVRHTFSRTIPAKSSDTVDFRAWVQPLSVDQRGDVTSPVLLRGTARFETEAGVIRTNFTTRGQ